MPNNKNTPTNSNDSSMKNSGQRETYKSGNPIPPPPKPQKPSEKTPGKSGQKNSDLSRPIRASDPMPPPPKSEPKNEPPERRGSNNPR